MLILPMVGVLHRVLSAILRRGKKLGVKGAQKLLARRAKATAGKKIARAMESGLLVKKVVQIAIGSKMKKSAAAQSRTTKECAKIIPSALPKATLKRVRKAKVSRKNLANVAPNVKVRRVARRVRSRKTQSQ